MVSGRWNTLDDDMGTLVLSALCGWVSTKVKRLSTDPPTNDADFIGNVCLGIHESGLFPKLVTEHIAPVNLSGTPSDGTRWFGPSAVDTLSDAHASFFNSWLDEVFNKCVREPENAVRREREREKHSLSLDDFSDYEEVLSDKGLLARTTRACSSNINVAHTVETRAEVRRLMSGLTSEDRYMCNLRAQGHSYQDIAHLMKKSKSTVAAQHTRIRQKATKSNRGSIGDGESEA